MGKFRDYLNEGSKKIKELNSMSRNNSSAYSDNKVLKFILSNFNWKITNSKQADARFHEIEINNVGTLKPDRGYTGRYNIISTNDDITIRLQDFTIYDIGISPAGKVVKDKGAVDFVKDINITNKKKENLKEWILNSYN